MKRPKPEKKIVKQDVDETPIAIDVYVEDDAQLYEPSSEPSSKTSRQAKPVKEEEEDKDLYAANDEMDVDDATFTTTITEDNIAEKNAEALQDVVLEKKYFCVVLREDGSLEVIKRDFVHDSFAVVTMTFSLDTEIAEL